MDGRTECAFGGYHKSEDRCLKNRVPGSLMCGEHRDWAKAKRLEIFPKSRWAKEMSYPVRQRLLQKSKQRVG